MNVCFDNVAIIGVGLLGGSLGLALKKRRLAGRICGVGHRQETLDKALAVGAIDQAFLDAATASDGADLVVLCTPAASVPVLLAEVLPVCSPKTILTDVASTKATICAWAHAHCPKPLRFIGSHPMAGSEKFGPEHADAELYTGCVTVVTTGDDQDPSARNAVCGLWRALGSRVVELDPVLHDRIVARTSHVPHIAAACAARCAAKGGDVAALVGGGFRDLTRIAAGRTELWRDICVTNRGGILDALDDFAADLDMVRDMIAREAADELAVFFESARLARRKALGESP